MPARRLRSGARHALPLETRRILRLSTLLTDVFLWAFSAAAVA
ncbi:MAG: hypothetical protein R3362_00925 [Rhodothermales bacterium]|nr:hypothetical protein [Rhodothermales bacterium]